MGEAKRDNNYITTLLAVSNVDGITPVTLYADPVTHRLLVSSAGVGGGDVVGPASSTDNALAVFDGITGKLLENSTAQLTATVLSPTVSDGVSLGSTTLMWSDVFLASGGVINFNNGNATLTHSAGLLTSNVDVAVPDEVYGSAWNASLEVPTKNAVYDKIEALSTGFGVYSVGPSGSGADYITDGTADEVQINQAIVDANAAGGGTVLLLPGTYTIAANIVPRSNVNIEGFGESSVVAIPSGLMIRNRTGGVTTGVPCDNVKIKNFKIDTTAQGALGGNEIAIALYNVQNVEVSHMRIIATGFGVFIGATTAANLGTQDSAHVWIHDNYMTGECRQDLIGGGENGDSDFIVYDVIIENNFLIHDYTVASPGGHFNAYDMVGAHQYIITNNVCCGSIYLGNERDPNQYSIISNNTVRPPFGSTTLMSGIVVQDENNTGDVSGKVLVTGNIVYGGPIRVSGRSSQKITNVHVVGNHVTNNVALTVNDQTGALTQNAIVINEATNCSVVGNHCYGPSVANSGIVLDDSAGCFVSANYVDGYTNGLTASGTVTTSFYSDNFTINYSTNGISTAVTSSAPNNYGGNPMRLSAQGNVTGATTFTRVDGSVITATLTGNITVTLTNGKVTGDTLTLVLTQDATGGRTVTWPSNFKQSGTLVLSTVASAVDIVNMTWDGTNWRETSRAGNLDVATRYLGSTAVTGSTASGGDTTIASTSHATKGSVWLDALDVSPLSSDLGSLGTSSLQWSDVFLAEGGVINWDNGDVTLTQTGNLLALAGGQFSFGANTAYFTETDNGNSGASDTIDWTLSNKQKSTLTANCTFTFTAPGGPCNLTLKLVQDATGSRTVTWPATVHWSGGSAPTLTTTASRVDIISFYWDGTTYFGASVLNFVA